MESVRVCARIIFIIVQRFLYRTTYTFKIADETVQKQQKSQTSLAPLHSALNKGQCRALMPTEETRNCSCHSVPVRSLLSPYSTYDVICTSPFPGTRYFSLHPRSAVLTVNQETEPKLHALPPTWTGVAKQQGFLPYSLRICRIGKLEVMGQTGASILSCGD